MENYFEKGAGTSLAVDWIYHLSIKLLEASWEKSENITFR